MSGQGRTRHHGNDRRQDQAGNANGHHDIGGGVYQRWLDRESSRNRYGPEFCGVDRDTPNNSQSLLTRQFVQSRWTDGLSCRFCSPVPPDKIYDRANAKSGTKSCPSAARSASMYARRVLLAVWRFVRPQVNRGPPFWTIRMSAASRDHRPFPLGNG